MQADTEEQIVRVRPLMRGCAAGLLFTAMMSVPISANLMAGRTVDAALLTWITPFAVGAALLPLHLRVGKVVLWSALYVTAGAALIGICLMLGLVSFSGFTRSFADTGADLEQQFGTVIYVVGVFVALPSIGVKARRLGFDWSWS